MTLSMPFRRVLLVGLVLMTMAGGLLTTASPAHADRCQPEELLGYNGLIPESAHPGCSVLINTVYPLVCSDYSTLGTCTASLNVLGTGATFNQCVRYGLLGDEVCAGTGGVSNNNAPVFGVIDVAAITDANKVCVVYDFTGRQACVGGRTPITTD